MVVPLSLKKLARSRATKHEQMKMMTRTLALCVSLPAFASAPKAIYIRIMRIIGGPSELPDTFSKTDPRGGMIAFAAASISAA
jgi:hypothetical protein